jgi:hypothetical protein
MMTVASRPPSREPGREGYRGGDLREVQSVARQQDHSPPVRGDVTDQVLLARLLVVLEQFDEIVKYRVGVVEAGLAHHQDHHGVAHEAFLYLSGMSSLNRGLPPGGRAAVGRGAARGGRDGRISQTSTTAGAEAVRGNIPPGGASVIAGIRWTAVSPTAAFAYLTWGCAWRWWGC